MKKTILTILTVAVAGMSLQNATAGDREWATAGKILTGVVAGTVIARALAPQPTYVYAPAPTYVYQPAPTYVYAPPPPAPAPVMVMPARVVYAAPPMVYAPAPVVCMPAPRVVYAAPPMVVYRPAPMVSFSFGGYHHGHGRGRW